MYTHCCLLFIVSLSLRCCAEFYVIDDKIGLGREFDGIGGLSGGGVSNVKGSSSVQLCLRTVSLSLVSKMWLTNCRFVHRPLRDFL